MITLHILVIYISSGPILFAIKDKTDLKRKKCNFHLEIINSDPLKHTIDHPKFIVSNQKEESFSAKELG